MLLDEVLRESSIAKFLTAWKNDPQDRESAFVVSGAAGALNSIITALLCKAGKRPLLAVVPTEREAVKLKNDLEILSLKGELFPAFGTAAYRNAPASSPDFAMRARTLSRLAAGKAGGIAGIVIATERAFLSPVPPPWYIKSRIFGLESGAQIDTRFVCEKLAVFGYTRVTRVEAPGEFVLRGEVLDIFPGGQDSAYRIRLDFDRIESIREFDCETQIPVMAAARNAAADDRVKKLVISPLKEVLWEDDLILNLAGKIAEYPEFKNSAQANDAAGVPSGTTLPGLAPGTAAMIDSLKIRRSAAGEELFYPLAFNETSSLLDYFPQPQSAVIFFERERMENGQESLAREYANLYRNCRRDNPGFAVPAPERLLLNFGTLAAGCACTVSFTQMRHTGPEVPAPCKFVINADPARHFFGNINYMKEEFSALLNAGWKIIITAVSDVQVLRLREILKNISALEIINLRLSEGFALPDIRLLVVQEDEIFGRYRRPPRSLKTAKSSVIDSFVELNTGDYIVHINYGIGKYLGIERVKTTGHERDYIKLEYADEEVVFVPIEQVNLIQRYIGNEGRPPALDRLGSKSWEARKEKARKAAEELAGRLIAIYSMRKSVQGFAFPPDTEWQLMFEAGFPYEETPDQLRCVEEVKADMEKNVPMDRLVCGDVGYGKTEVALRACFKAVMGGKQVAFLAPTTILAEQHYETFKERFSKFPVSIAMLSRFTDGRAAKKAIADLKSGALDIIIGTHRIIQDDVRFRDLGLLVIDEEQRFGVKHKERLKELKHNVDCLALSATPIPRTLHMSLLKIRDMSLLTTPPQNRQAIETFIGEYSDELVANAIRAEAARGGQVFYLHNQIEQLDSVRAHLEQLVPEMLIQSAHGQLQARELEDIMYRFVHGGFQVLVSTTIIENGIDIPNVNTIIIDRADRYGISQLYQLRGRVGRSERQAYAYLFYPESKALPVNAMKRLAAISDYTELGSGFKIAMKDMEIRGAGNILGREQSGVLYSVGFDMYMHLLDNAIQKLQNGNFESEIETLLELEYSGFIPDSYIADPQQKMEIYKKIASIRTGNELDSVCRETEERFGPIPAAIHSLLSLAEIKIICRGLSIVSLKERGGVVRIEFAGTSKINIERLLRLISESAGKIKIDSGAPNVVLLKTGSIGLKEKSEYIREKLSLLLPKV